jgi:hypothetical protein
MYQLFSLLVFIGIGAAAYAAYRYRQKHSANWSDKKRERFDLIASLVIAAALLGKFSVDVVRSNAEVKLAQAEVEKANRNLWESVKTLPLGMEITSVALNQLRKDLEHHPEDLRRALGETEFQAFKDMLAAEDLRVAAVDELSKKLNKAKAELKQIEVDLNEARKSAGKFAELKTAADAVQEKRRIAPLGSFQITVTVKHKQDAALESLGIGIVRTRLECFDSESYAQNGDFDVYTFKKVSKPYAEEVQQRLQKLGATVIISEASAN